MIEALTLITKIENAVKTLERDAERNYESSSLSNNSKQNDNDMLLDEVLNSEKSRNTNVPLQIEDQLKALYKLLSEEKMKRFGKSLIIIIITSLYTL